MISMPKTAEERKLHPVTTGVLDYFPDAILAIANVSLQGNEQHNPGQPLHWDRSKSQDEADALVRHLMERGTKDSDGTRHSAKMAWRALALLQKEIESEYEHAPGVLIKDECSELTGWKLKWSEPQDPTSFEPKKRSLFPYISGLESCRCDTGYVCVACVRHQVSDRDSQADGHKDAECEWCGYRQSECECVKWDKGL